MAKINLILLVKRFYLPSVGKFTLQVIFNEDSFLKFIIVHVHNGIY